MAKYKAIRRAVEQAHEEMDLWAKARALHAKRPGMADIIKQAKKSPQKPEAARKGDAVA